MALLAGCAATTREVFVRPDATFTREATVLVRSEHGDPLSIQRKLEAILIEQGYRVAESREQNPGYLLRFRYGAVGGLGFRALVVPLAGGEPEAVLEYAGPAIWSVEQVLRDLIKTLDERLRERSPRTPSRSIRLPGPGAPYVRSAVGSTCTITSCRPPDPFGKARSRAAGWGPPRPSVARAASTCSPARSGRHT